MTARRQSPRRRPADLSALPAGLVDVGTPERHRQGDRIVLVPPREDGGGQAPGPAPAVARVTTQTVLDRYLVRGQLDDAADDGAAARRMQAATRFYADWRACALQPAVVARYAERTDRATVAGDPTAHRYIAFRRAVQAVGAQLSPMLEHVVLHDLPAGEWTAARRYGAQAAMPILHLALDALAAHYGLR